MSCIYYKKICNKTKKKNLHNCQHCSKCNPPKFAAIILRHTPFRKGVVLQVPYKNVHPT